MAEKGRVVRGRLMAGKARKVVRCILGADWDYLEVFLFLVLLVLGIQIEAEIVRYHVSR